MKKFLKNPVVIMCFVFTLLLSYFMFSNMADDFYELYIGKLSFIFTRYIILAFVVYLDYYLFNSINYASVIFRNKSILNFLISSLIKSVKYILLFFIMLNIPIFIFNSSEFISNIKIILLCFINDVVISMLFISIIRLIDSKLKNKIISSCMFLGGMGLLDIILEQINYNFVNNIIFQFNYIFVLPAVYSNYLLILIFMIFLTILFITISSKLIVKGDYMLNEQVVEDN